MLSNLYKNYSWQTHKRYGASLETYWIALFMTIRKCNSKSEVQVKRLNGRLSPNHDSDFISTSPQLIDGSASGKYVSFQDPSRADIDPNDNKLNSRSF